MSNHKKDSPPPDYPPWGFMLADALIGSRLPRGASDGLASKRNDKTFEVRHHGDAMLQVTLKEATMVEHFLDIILGERAMRAGIDVSDRDAISEWEARFRDTQAFQDIVADVNEVVEFIRRHMPKIQDKIFSILLFAGVERQFQNDDQQSDFFDQLHRTFSLLEKDVRRATRTLRPGPKLSWTKSELEAATRATVRKILNGNDEPTLMVVAAKINHDHLDKKPFTSKAHSSLGKAFGKRLRDLGINWSVLVEDERRQINEG